MRTWIVSTFLIATGGLLYEVFLGAFGSYLFGDSVKVFSLTTGFYMFAMGLGAFSVKPDLQKPATRLLQVELALTLLHLLSPILIWFAFAEGIGAAPSFWAVLILSGYLVGTEIPLVLSVLRSIQGSSDQHIHRILAADYLGALAASLAFGFWLLPVKGLLGGSAFSALCEALGGLGVLWALRKQSGQNGWRAVFVVLTAVSFFALLFAEPAQKWLEERAIRALNPTAHVVHTEWTGISHVTVYSFPDTLTKRPEHVLLLNRQHQWSTSDLDYYHEILTVPAVESWKRNTRRTDPPRVLILGGGDGFAAETLHREYGAKDITLVDIDPRISEIGLSLPFWKDRGGYFLESKDLHLLHEDAFAFVRKAAKENQTWDIVIMDFPDPDSPALARFFTPFFLSHLAKVLNPGGHVSIQSSIQPNSPEGQRKFACLQESIFQDLGLKTKVLIGDEADLYVVAAKGEILFPKDEEKTPARVFVDGRRLRLMAVDTMSWFGENCPQSPVSGLLQPKVLTL